MSHASPWIITRRVVSIAFPLAVLLALFWFFGGTYSVLLVDTIPAIVGTEEKGNSEASLAVNAEDPMQVVVAAHQLGRYGPCTTDLQYNAGLLESQDGGKTWALSCGVPLEEKTFAGDPSLAFAGDGSTLLLAYMSPLGFDSAHEEEVQVVKVSGLFDGDAKVSTSPVLEHLKSTDQPAVATADGADLSHTWIGIWDGIQQAAGCNGGGVVYLPNAAGLFEPACVSRRPSDFSIYSVRVDGHKNADAYAAFYSLTPDDDTRFNVVVTRDDGASSVNQFGQLLDNGTTTTPVCSPPDGREGVRIARCVPVPWDDFYNGGTEGDPSDDTFPAMGLQRRRFSSIAIAVDRDKTNRVCAAWGDQAGTSLLDLHVRCSEDSGASWSNPFTEESATNPALAIDSNGRVGFLFQKLVTDTDGSHWETTLAVLTLDADGDFDVDSRILLAKTPFGRDLWNITPFLGDYTELQSHGTSFSGAFGAVFSPDCAWYRSTFVYERDVPQARCGGTVDPAAPKASVDPFYFRVQRRWWRVWFEWVAYQIF